MSVRYKAAVQHCLHRWSGAGVGRRPAANARRWMVAVSNSCMGHTGLVGAVTRMLRAYIEVNKAHQSGSQQTRGPRGHQPAPAPPSRVPAYAASFAPAPRATRLGTNCII